MANKPTPGIDPILKYISWCGDAIETAIYSKDVPFKTQNEERAVSL